MSADVDGYEVLVKVSFPVSAEKARRVLERWWAFKEKRKAYMRARRLGRMKPRGVSRGAVE